MTFPEPPQDATDKMLLRALRYYSDNCEPGELHPDCPYSVPTKSGLGCGEECLNYLAENAPEEAEGAPETLSAGLGYRPIRRTQFRRGPESNRPAFDCGQVKLEEAQLSLIRQSVTSLLGSLADLLVEPPSPQQVNADRVKSLNAISSELYRRGIDVDGLVRETLLPMAAQLVCISVAIAIYGGDELPKDWRYHLRSGWTELLLETDGDTGQAIADLRSKGIDESGPILARIMTDGVNRVQVWLDALSLDEIFRWQVPTRDQYQALTGEPTRTFAGVNSWLYERFTSTYLETWSTESLNLEWRYLHGRQVAPCNQSQMASRRIDRAELACVMASRLSSGESSRTPDRLVMGKYVGVALDLLRKGERVAAFNIFDVACSLSPESGEAHNNRGFCRLPDDSSAALADFQRARRLGTSDPFVTAGNQMLALHKLARNSAALKIAEDSWTWNVDCASLATMWDFRSDEPALLHLDSLQYLADLAETIASRSHDVVGAALWNSRLGSRQTCLQGRDSN